jgi:hypothetical protein
VHLSGCVKTEGRCPVVHMTCISSFFGVVLSYAVRDPVIVQNLCQN